MALLSAWSLRSGWLRTISTEPLGVAQADAARLSGHPHEAVTSLRRIVGSHSHDPRAAMAAFTLGRLLLEGLGQPMQASFVARADGHTIANTQGAFAGACLGVSYALFI